MTLSVLCAGGVAASTKAENPSTIHAGAIRAHLEFLASDLLEGRDAGTRGYDLAANYVASMYEQIGLQPAGTKGFMQPVPLRSSLLVPNSVKLSVQGAGGIRTFTDADHVAARPSSTEAEQSLEADCVFAGFGIVSPEHKRDDYAGLDVRGKFVVVLGGPPPGLPSEVAGHLGSTAEQRSRAAERGALGVFIVYTPALEARWPFVRLAAVYAQPQMEWFDPSIPRPPGDQLRVSALDRRNCCCRALRTSATQFASRDEGGAYASTTRFRACNARQVRSAQPAFAGHERKRRRHAAG